MQPDAALTTLRGVGPKRASALAAEGLHRVADLLWLLPSGYQELGPLVGPSEVFEPAVLRVAGELRRIRHRRLRGRGALVEAELHDAAGGTLEVVWFQHRSLADRLRREPRVVLFGAVRERNGRLQLNHPEVLALVPGEAEVEPIATVEIPPPRARYRALAGLSERQVAGLVEQVVNALDPRFPPEPLPDELLTELAVPPLSEALRSIHRPPVGIDLVAWSERSSAPYRRLAFDELLAHQRRLASGYAAHRGRRKEHHYQVDDRVRQIARDILPFRLTGAQKRAVGEMAAELQAPVPMLRLLQGDVGSGKTIVAALLMLLAAESGVQAALLAPTEILAEQHAASLQELFDGRYPVALRTSSAPAGSTDSSAAALVVGTHALLEDSVSLPRLGLVIIDEQHRFGVTQRQLMVEKGRDVDLLVMSATPIPRTLALAGYGDLDLTLLDELPPGRSPVETLVRPKKERRPIYARLRADLEQGRQGYVVFPAIEPSEVPGLTSLEAMAPKIEEGLAGVRTARLHGQLSADERRTILAEFRRGEIQLLLSTTVIEVGIDVPRASAMIIEGAERFGLAQLHQLRGRVGRGTESSWCAAVHGRLNETGSQRLTAFAECPDGFAIAERDLAIRGPGELLGRRQAGMIAFRVADLGRDTDLLEVAQRVARREMSEASPATREIDGEVRWFVS